MKVIISLKNFLEECIEANLKFKNKVTKFIGLQKKQYL